MSSSAKIQSSRRLKKVRLLSLFNPLFLATTGIFSLFAFAIWQYWLNPDFGNISVQTPETSQENQQKNQQNVAEKNKENIAESDQQANNKINALESITNNTNNNSQIQTPPTAEQQLSSILSQTNPTNDIFKSLTTQNNRNQTTGGAKLYEQLRNLPNLFPDLLPAQTANNGIINSSVVGNTTVPTNQLTQYQLRSNIQGASIATTTPLSQAVNNVMSNRNAANTNTQTSQQTPYNNINTNVPANTTVAPNSNYSNYGNNNAYGNYGNYGNTNAYGNSYGGNVNGVGVNPYNSGQLPVQGYNNNRVTQTGFPTSRF